MLSFFKKSNKSSVKVLEDKIWLNKAMRFKGIFNYAKELANDGRVVIIATFFEDTFKELSFVLRNANLQFEEIGNLSSTHFNLSHIYLTSTQSITDLKSFERWINLPITIIISEHFPVPTKEEELQSKLGVHNFDDLKVQYFDSMDSALMNHFGSERIQSLLTQLGLNEDEELSHKFINKSIRNAQAKIAKSITHEKQASSQNEWFELNAKNLN